MSLSSYLTNLTLESSKELLEATNDMLVIVRRDIQFPWAKFDVRTRTVEVINE